MRNTKIDDILKNGREWLTALRDRINQNLAGRSRQVVAVATLAGVALIGLVAATIDTTPTPDVSTASVDADRSQAADRGNRAVREPQSPAANAETPAAAEAPAQAPGTQAPAAEAAPAPAPEVKKAEWVLPIEAPISSCFGPRWGTEHKGIDFAADENTNIHAVGSGEVIAAGWVYTGYGISVVVDHGNGFQTHYAHMNKTAVSVGQHVNTGDLLGYEGSTGDSTGPHLHFEVHQGMWNQVDPASWMRDHGVPIDGC
ncbi:MAG TPA: M23 family metallopeptidase [Candidatus Limnocylindrales bacterium]